MSLQETAFLAIWNDILPECEDEYNEWQTKEHIPERVGIPGFLAGRRYVNWEADYVRYFTLYEGENLEAFKGAPYLERLNSPTPWTKKMMHNFRNFIRGACRTVISEGNGVGGALAAISVLRRDHNGGNEHGDLTALAGQLLAMEGITGVHIGFANQEVTGIKTTEKSLRESTEEHIFELLVLVEGNGREVIRKSIATIELKVKTTFPGIEDMHREIYDLAYLLHSH